MTTLEKEELIDKIQELPDQFIDEANSARPPAFMRQLPKVFAQCSRFHRSSSHSFFF